MITYLNSNETRTVQANVTNGSWSTTIAAPIVNSGTNDAIKAEDRDSGQTYDKKGCTIKKT